MELLISELKLKRQQTKEYEDSLMKIQKETIDLFSYNGFKPTFELIESGILDIYIEEPKSFIIGYSDLFKENNTVSFHYNVSEDKVSVRPFVISQQRDDTQVEYFEKFLKTVINLNQNAFNFDNQSLFNDLTHYIELKKEIKNNKIKIESLLKTIRLEKDNQKLTKFYNILPHINNFCIDSFLCEKFNIKFNIKPNRKNLKDLKLAILKENKGIPNACDIQYDFIVHHKKSKQINFTIYTLYISTMNAKLKLETYYGDDITSKKGINKTLSEQFLYNDTLVCYESIKKNKPFNNFVEQVFQKYSTGTYLSFDRIEKNLHFLTTPQKINSF